MLGLFRVVNPHSSDVDEPLVLPLGERIRWERRTTQWAGWLWVEKETGCSGWVPEAWMTIEGASATMKRDYDATELTVNQGERLQGDLIESEWLLARDESGRLGWVPLNCVETVS